jgi:hypothetical protein
MAATKYKMQAVKNNFSQKRNYVYECITAEQSLTIFPFRVLHEIHIWQI